MSVSLRKIRRNEAGISMMEAGMVMALLIGIGLPSAKSTYKLLATTQSKVIQQQVHDVAKGYTSYPGAAWSSKYKKPLKESPNEADPRAQEIVYPVGKI
ncbi:MAG: hypothetical protein H6619_02860 [Deltaproteobacteria bacterium]|nr:hypothetical protein [Deltaproteobacteria bacterium]